MLTKAQIIFILVIWLIAYTAIILMPLLDLRSGVKKARARGEDISSDRLKDTIKKMTNYLLFSAAMSVVDVLQMGLVHYLAVFYAWTSIPLLPAFSVIASFGCCAIEVRSIYENNDIKTKREAKEVAKLAAAIIASRGDIKKSAMAAGAFLGQIKEEET